MKKKILLMILVLVFGSTACTNVVIEKEEQEQEQEEVTNQNKEDKKEEVVDNKEENKENPVKNMVTVKVYYPNDNADGTNIEEMQCEELTPEAIWLLLKEKDVVTGDTAVNSLEQEGNILNLDVNEAFGNQLRSYGVAGETMLMQSVVNTFLDAYGCEKIKITENGETLCSGHMEYAEYVEKYE